MENRKRIRNLWESLAEHPIRTLLALGIIADIVISIFGPEKSIIHITRIESPEK